MKKTTANSEPSTTHKADIPVPLSNPRFRVRTVDNVLHNYHSGALIETTAWVHAATLAPVNLGFTGVA